MDSNRENDIGQQLTEDEWTTAQVLWNQFDKERAAINRAFGACRAGEDRTTVELEYSMAILELQEPPMPRPGPRPGTHRPLTIISNDGRTVDLFADRQAG